MFPVLIANQFGGFENAPDPLKYAFYGPLVGSIIRVIGGPLADRLGGAILTTISGLGIIVGTLVVAQYVKPTSGDDFTGFFMGMLIVFFFAGLGNASTFKQMPMLFEPKMAAAVIGFTAAIAAYGPFVFNVITKSVVSATGSPAGFFYGLAVFALLNVSLNIYYFNRKGAPNPC
jgi:NNP family nitrate/nitrite transporter-like MFS transporter